jgi:hypothetical protein
MFGGGTLSVTNTFTSARNIFLNSAGGTIRISPATTLTLTSPLSGVDGAPLTVQGGYLALDTGSSRTGDTFVSGSYVDLKDATALGTGRIHLESPFSGILIYATAPVANEVDISADNAGLGGVGNATFSGSVKISPDVKTVTLSDGGNVPGTSFTVGTGPGTVSGGSSQTNIQIPNGSYSHNVFVPFANPDFAGTWTIGGSALRIGDPQSLGTGTTPIEVDAGGRLILDDTTCARDVLLKCELRGDGAQAKATGRITIDSSSAGAAVLGTMSAGAVLTIGDEPNDLTGGGADDVIDIGGPGTVVLAEPSDYVGYWSANSGTLEVNAPGALGNTSNSFEAWAHVILNAPQRVNYFHVGDSGDVQLAHNGSNTLTCRNFTMVSWGPVPSRGKFDMTDNAMVVQQGVVGSWNGGSGRA